MNVRTWIDCDEGTEGIRGGRPRGLRTYQCECLRCGNWSIIDWTGPMPKRPPVFCTCTKLGHRMFLTELDKL